MFKAGDVIHAQDGSQIIIVRHIKDGAQGVVYEVDHLGERKALKWYKQDRIIKPDAFYRILCDKMLRGNPDKAFLWPIAVTKQEHGSFGYLMDLVTDQYVELTKVLVSAGGGGFESFKQVVDAAIHIVTAFRKLHIRGYAYQDMNSGNFLLRPKTGDVLICDSDNIAPNGTDTGIIGTPEYMAPEIVMGKAKPNTHTDEFSLAVVLFLLLCGTHPLQGRHWAEAPCLTPEIQKALYGSHALFIFDPDDHSNRPVPGVQKNAYSRWEFLPDYMRAIFTEAFSQQAIADPNRRVIEMIWLKALLRFRSEIVQCRGCGNEIFIMESCDTNCEKCGRLFRVERQFKLPEYSLAAVKDARIYRCQLETCNPEKALDVVGEVVTAGADDQYLGFRNESNQVLMGYTPGGKENQVNPGDIVPLKAGIRLEAHDRLIEIR